MRYELRQIAINNLFRLSKQLTSGQIDSDRFTLLANKEMAILKALLHN